MMYPNPELLWNYHKIPENGFKKEEKFGILHRLYDLNRQTSIGSTLIERISNDPSITTVVVFGEPGSGKSTIIGQLIKNLLQDSDYRIKTRLVRFDDIREESCNAFGKRPSEWDTQQKEVFTKRFISKIDSPAESPTRRKTLAKYEKEITVVEMFGVSSQSSDHQVLTYLAESAKSNSKSARTMFIGLVPDLTIQFDSMEIRRSVRRLSEIQDVEKTLERFGIKVKFIGKPPPNPLRRSSLIHTQISRSAEPEKILEWAKKIYREANATHLSIRRSLIEKGDTKAFIMLNQWIKDQLVYEPLLSVLAQGVLGVKILHVNQLLSTTLALPNDDCYTVLNKRSEEYRTMYISKGT